MIDTAWRAPPKPQHSGRRELLRFPYRRIIANWTLEEVFARFVWLAIPLEYFIATRFTGGLGSMHGVAAALVALLSLLAVLVTSLTLAAVPRPAGLSYAERIRIWSVSMVLNWTAALCLLALGYAPGLVYKMPYDVVASLIYHWLDDQLWQLDNYPSILDPATFIVYICYALAGVLLIDVIAWLFGRDPEEPMPSGPNVIVVVGLTAFVMMVMHGYTKLP